MAVTSRIFEADWGVSTDDKDDSYVCPTHSVLASCFEAVCLRLAAIPMNPAGLTVSTSALVIRPPLDGGLWSTITFIHEIRAMNKIQASESELGVAVKPLY